MRTQLQIFCLAAIFGFGLVACGDDDGGQNNVNQNNNSAVTCGDNVAAGMETCDGPDLRNSDCASIDQGFTGGALACNSFCDGWDTSACTGGTTCGDSQVEGTELCDLTNLDGNDCTTIGEGFTFGTLACNADCMSWDTAGCITTTCGDDTAEGGELCDGSDLDSQECTTIGQGFIGGTLACNGSCNGWLTTGCTSPTCGDDNAEGNEVCDGTDLGNNDCTTVPGNFTGGTLGCNGNCNGWDTSLCTGGAPFCGDSNVDTGEDCDLLNLDNNDCTTITGGFTGGTLSCNTNCTFNTAACTSVPLTCGNGVFDTGELCDGNELNSNDCTTVGGGYSGGVLACSSSCTFNVAGCYGGTSTCGNNAAEGGETCDGSDLNGETCVSLNYGYTGGDLGCHADCKLWDTSQCTVSAPVCGDGIIEGATEECDSSELDGAACTDFSFTGGILACTTSCLYDYTGCTSGVAGWTCDPSFYGNSDGCDCGCGIVDPDCTDSTSASCDYCADIGSCDLVSCANANSTIDSANNAVCTTATCGNNSAEGLEWCDGQDLRGFACEDLNPNYVGGTLACAGNCAFDETGCTQAICGDNSADGQEWCDGQDLQGADCADIGYSSGSLTCDANCNFITTQCVATVCGDGTTEGFEECDDNNTTDGDGCNGGCRIEWTLGTETEPNNDDTSANGPFTNYNLITAAVATAGDHDYFSVQVPAGATLYVEVSDGGTGACANQFIDSEVEIYDTDGTTSLASNDDIDLTNYCSVTQLTGLAAGTYFVRAASSQTYDPTGTFNYVLVIAVF